MCTFRSTSRLVHQQLIQSGCESDVFVCNSLVDMYAKCGSIVEGWRALRRCGHLECDSIGTCEM
jgi:pentatricopeptide repeat protein